MEKVYGISDSLRLCGVSLLLLDPENEILPTLRPKQPMKDWRSYLASQKKSKFGLAVVDGWDPSQAPNYTYSPRKNFSDMGENFSE